MGPKLSALVALQGIELDLAKLRRRKATRQRAVNTQQAKIDHLTAELHSLTQIIMEKRAAADAFDLEVKSREEHLDKLRVTLNSARTNKEYASVLTEINSFRADSDKNAEQGLKILEEVDALTAQTDTLKTQIAEHEIKLQSVQAENAGELAKLEEMIEKLTAQRTDASRDIDPSTLAMFDRLAGQYDGEAMAEVHVEGRKSPYTYICGGCYMSLNAEHANALRSRDEIRQCGNCQRILYIEDKAGD